MEKTPGNRKSNVSKAVFRRLQRIVFFTYLRDSLASGKYNILRKPLRFQKTPQKRIVFYTYLRDSLAGAAANSLLRTFLKRFHRGSCYY
jgi:hypothetical protein